MRLLPVLALVLFAFTGTVLSASKDLVEQPLSEEVQNKDLLQSDESFEIIINDEEEGPVVAAPQFILSWKARQMIRNLQHQMPCGWEKYGIPPLAPFRLNKAELNIKEGLLESFNSVFRLKIDNLNKFIIKRFKLNAVKSKVNFDFLFKSLPISAQQFETNTLFDALQELGISAQYEGNGTLGINLINMRLVGTLKYKLPVLWGSAKITSLKTTVSVEQCTSEITGLAGNGSLNRLMNQQVEKVLVYAINNNQQKISDQIESIVVRKVNKLLKGKDFWTLIDLIFSSDDNESGENGNGPENEFENEPIATCIPPADPWA